MPLFVDYPLLSVASGLSGRWRLCSRGSGLVLNNRSRSRTWRYLTDDDDDDDDEKYAHIEIVVTFLVVNFFGFLVITRDHGSFEGSH